MYQPKPISQLVSQDAVQAVSRRQLLEARLQHRGAQLRNFHRQAHRLASRQLDVQATYNRLQELYEVDRMERHKLRPSPLPPQPVREGDEIIPYGADLARESLMAPVWLGGVPPEFTFGYAGDVPIPIPVEGVSITPNNPFMAGELVTVTLYSGGICFNGLIEDTRTSIPGGQYDPAETHVWLLNWKFLVPFPPALSRSRFTYQFEIASRASVRNRENYDATFMSFATFGESADYTPGDNIEVVNESYWPLIADLGQPSTEIGDYDGSQGYLDGKSKVQGSFIVGKGKAPAIAVIVGAIGIISMLGRTLYVSGAGYSRFDFQSGNGMEGRVSFHYAPLAVTVP